jgi:hypothetical protein
MQNNRVEQIAKHSGTYTLQQIEDQTAVNKATIDLLGQMGVPLTALARAELGQAANENTQAGQKGMSDAAYRISNGDDIGGQHAAYIAVETDPSLMSEANSASLVAANIRTGNIGQDMRNDLQWGKDWEARLAKTEQYFDNFFKTFNQPYALIYTPELQTGTIDTINRRDETNWVKFTVELRERSNWTNPVLKTVNDVWRDINATGRKTVWGLADWPRYRNPFTNGSKRLTIAVELLNEQGKVIGQQTFTEQGSWSFSFNQNVGIEKFDSWGEDAKTITFPTVKIADWTDKMTLRFITVNNVPVADASKNGVLMITTRALYRDAAGFDYDGGGYGWDGYDKTGYDRDGYGRDGFNREGYDRDGYDIAGYDRGGYDRAGYDRGGFNRDGYTVDGSLYDMAGYDRDGFNRDGYGRAGYDRDGFNRDGYTVDGSLYDIAGYDRDGFNREGYDMAGYNRYGWRYSGYSDTIWFDIRGYFDWHFINIFDQSSELESGYYETYTKADGAEGTRREDEDKAKQWLYGGKFGIDFGIRHFTIGAYFALAGYQAHYIRKSDASDYGTVGGFGFGGDLSVGYSIYYVENDGKIPLRATISTGITVLHFSENPLNVPTILPYLQLSVFGFPTVFSSVGLKLEFPVINGAVSPRFGLEFGLGSGGGRAAKQKQYKK